MHRGLRLLFETGNRGVATLLVEVCAKPLRRRALPCASVSPSRPSRPPGMSTGKEASVPSDAAATDRHLASPLITASVVALCSCSGTRLPSIKMASAEPPFSSATAYCEGCVHECE